MTEVLVPVIITAMAFAAGLLIGWLFARGLPDREEAKRTAFTKRYDQFAMVIFGRVLRELNGRTFILSDQHPLSYTTNLNMAFSVGDDLNALAHRPLRWVYGNQCFPVNAYQQPEGVTTAVAFAALHTLIEPERPQGVAYAKCIRDEKSGLVLRFVADWFPSEDTTIIRVDARGR